MSATMHACAIQAATVCALQLSMSGRSGCDDGGDDGDDESLTMKIIVMRCSRGAVGKSALRCFVSSRQYVFRTRTHAAMHTPFSCRGVRLVVEEDQLTTGCGVAEPAHSTDRWSAFTVHAHWSIFRTVSRSKHAHTLHTVCLTTVAMATMTSTSATVYYFFRLLLVASFATHPFFC